MRGAETLSIPVTEKAKYFPDGTIVGVTAEKKEKKRTIPGGTAKHEAMHAVAAEENGTSVSLATIVPGEGYLGLTVLSRPDAVAAAAPHAHGHSGTSHDMKIVEFMGVSPSAASNAARNIIGRNSHKVEAVASHLQDNKSLSGFEVRNTMSDAEEELRNPVYEAIVTVKNPLGEVRKFDRIEARNSTVMVPGEWVIFPKNPKDKFETSNLSKAA